MAKRGNGALSPKDFTLQAIGALRTERSKGIHTVFSGFNDAFRAYFEGADPIKALAALEKQGVVQLRPAKKGCMLYVKGEMPTSAESNVRKAEDALAKILA